ncbi:MAG: alpha-amylase family glycosyl hydrolase [Nitriliruptoraceae bacterium]
MSPVSEAMPRLERDHAHEPEGSTHDRDPWWTQAVGYQVYLRSFNDHDGDGIGDLLGLTNRLDHIARLGVDYLWITPFYPSPHADHGYDVSDHTDVDPIFGRLEDVDAVVERAHALGLRVVIDVVPNHTSNQHPWFQDALTGRDATFRDHYVWRDPAPDGGRPNNWVSKFGGPAWSWHAPSGQYYLHTFLPQQPDLNWSNPAVHRAFEDVLRFWMARGVDGFRIDTAHLLTKDPCYRDNPRLHQVPDNADAETVYYSFDHRHDLDQADVVEIYRRWRQITRSSGALLLGEVGLFEAELVGRYVADGVLDLAFYFPTLKVGWDAASIRKVLAEGLDHGAQRLAWPLSSHDDPRATQRFGGGRHGADRALAYLTLLSGLPGNTFILQGDELGLDGSQLPLESQVDPVATRGGGAFGRDASRTPMPWSNDPNFGFTTGEPWLPFPSDLDVEHTAAWQESTPDSPLARTRRLLTIRKQLPDLLGAAPVTWLDAADDVVAYRRGQTVVATNLAASPRPRPDGRELIERYRSTPTPNDNGHDIPADTTVLLTPR